MRTKTLDDIAKLAGVSSGAVSLALRDSPELSEALKKKIRAIADENNFVPRRYRRSKKATAKSLGEDLPTRLRDETPGKVLLIRFRSECYESVNVELEMAIMNRFAEQGVAFDVLDCAALLENPALASSYAGIVYYFDPPGLQLPEDVPQVQVFGFEPLPEGRDRVTTNDQQIAEIAADHLIANGARRSISICRTDFVVGPQHPRLQAFAQRMREAEIGCAEILYPPEASDLAPWLDELLQHDDGATGIFAFNDICALMLFCYLNKRGLWNRYREAGVICGDNTRLLRAFWQNSPAVELSLTDMGTLAADTILYKIRNPRLGNSVHVMEARLAAGEALVSPSDLATQEAAVSRNAH